jgi:hypothetical protein
VCLWTYPNGEIGILVFGFLVRTDEARILISLESGVSTPQMIGNPDFERVVRVQQNTLEQMVFFLPALWLFCYINTRQS